VVVVPDHGIAWLLIAMVVLRFNIASIATVGILLGALFLAAAINEFSRPRSTLAMGAHHPRDRVRVRVAGASSGRSTRSGRWHPCSGSAGAAGLDDLDRLVMAKGPMWGLGLSVGILEILLASGPRSRSTRARLLILIWVGLMALFRGIGQIVFAFELRREEA
jgi:hypothetical protein